MDRTVWSFAACLRNGKWATEQGRPISGSKTSLPVGEAVLYLIPLQRDRRIVLPVVDLSYAVK